MLYKKLVGEKVYLSPINSKYYEKYTEWLNSMDVTIGLGIFNQIWSVEAEKKKLEEMELDNTVRQFAIARADTNELIGNCGIFSINNINRSATVGIFIGDKNNRTIGLGRDAMALLLDFAFSYLNIHTINLELFEFNEVAYNMYKKVGFKEVGRFREKAYIKGEYHNTIVMDITKADFSKSVYNGHIKTATL